MIRDNLASVKEVIEGRGAALVYLSPYSPDSNPIEQVFAKSYITLSPRSSSNSQQTNA